MTFITIELELVQGYSLADNEEFIMSALLAAGIDDVFVSLNEIGVFKTNEIEAKILARRVINAISEFGLTVRRVR